ncbi:DNA cytosine methyltransferase [Clostridioides difficile]|uniref:DNA-cytosine methyltransferase n=3 Tax=Clostridioides difficile TaxID=1496 RepID=A0A381I6I6_CLODI|nr:DNA cytosine methyltransferase [Clostridioides difficile]SJP22882.1 Modification methylase BanI [Clostridioides difficile]SJP27229.1 Modification methylase BanI [Clostridioides difficile]SJR69988.1 Modification methylase BanI [Clostridioides difficile]SJU37077.1 Modification methylase BanI [Clostridioides difficile]SUY22275.1 DNA-cytosine methyltransferase [Clostridioides difficile]
MTNRNCDNSGVLVNAVLTPDRVNKRQNGRRIKESGETMFTLTAQDKHGILKNGDIRRLTPKECFRLQGFPDKYYERAASVCSDSQLYKQAGNAVTANVVYEIAKRMG